MTEWKYLLCGERYKGERRGKAKKAFRETFTDMQRDYDLIVNTTSFRRLQRKAQVYVCTESDFVRTRLTHTLEVVAIGKMLVSAVVRSLEGSKYALSSGWKDASFIKARKKKGISRRDIVESVAAACLAHDIGNPPFGHVGEYAIRSWFNDQQKSANPNRKCLLKILDSEGGKDFLYFDGNAQGFRAITALIAWRNEGGLRLTYDTLATFHKYSEPISNIEKKQNSKTFPKYSVFSTESQQFEDVFRKLKLIKINDANQKVFFRHPWSYLMEAADDIAYCCSDIEDGYKMGLIPYDDARDALYELSRIRISELGYNSRVQDLKRKLAQGEFLKYLSVSAKNSLTHSCHAAFFNVSSQDGITNYQKMLVGDFDSTLIKCCSLSSEYYNAKSLSQKYIYANRDKITKEQGSHQIIRYLCSLFSDAIEDWHEKSGNVSEISERTVNTLMVLHRINDYSAFYGSDVRAHPNLYSLRSASAFAHYHVMVDFISGMTDDYAVKLAQRMRGFDLA